MASKSLAERTKVVVRNLPPTLSAEAFQGALDKAAADSFNWLAYYPGKFRCLGVALGLRAAWRWPQQAR